MTNTYKTWALDENADHFKHMLNIPTGFHFMMPTEVDCKKCLSFISTAQVSNLLMWYMDRPVIFDSSPAPYIARISLSEIRIYIDRYKMSHKQILDILTIIALKIRHYATCDLRSIPLYSTQLWNPMLKKLEHIKNTTYIHFAMAA